MSYYLYKLVPPRPSFDTDMSDEERTIMGAHIRYWSELAQQGTAVVFGPVSGDPAGSWGLAITEADDVAQVRGLGASDPAISSGMATFEVYEMPRAMLRAQQSAPQPTAGHDN